jgi:hypothetical protein
MPMWKAVLFVAGLCVGVGLVSNIIDKLGWGQTLMKMAPALALVLVTVALTVLWMRAGPTAILAIVLVLGSIWGLLALLDWLDHKA